MLQTLNPEQISSATTKPKSSTAIKFKFKFVPFDEGDKIRLDNDDQLFINDNEGQSFKRATSDSMINKGFLNDQNDPFKLADDGFSIEDKSLRAEIDTVYVEYMVQQFSGSKIVLGFAVLDEELGIRRDKVLVSISDEGVVLVQQTKPHLEQTYKGFDQEKELIRVQIDYRNKNFEVFLQEIDLPNQLKKIGQFSLYEEITFGVAFCPLAYLQGPSKVLIFDDSQFSKPAQSQVVAQSAQNCPICLQNFKPLMDNHAALVPCGHLLCSKDCANTQWGNKCPLCKIQVRAIQEISMTKDK